MCQLSLFLKRAIGLEGVCRARPVFEVVFIGVNAFVEGQSRVEAKPVA
jgi:hypothetical protein